MGTGGIRKVNFSPFFCNFPISVALLLCSANEKDKTTIKKLIYL